MIRSRIDAGPYQVDVWEEPTPGVHRSSQDTSLVLHRGAGLRVAAIDGATPHPDAEIQLGCDSAVYAAAVSRMALHAPVQIEQALATVNARLFAMSHEPWLRPRCSLVACDLALGELHLVRAGDCQAFVKQDDKWQAVMPELLSPEARDRRLAKYGALTLQELLQVEDQDPEQFIEGWLTTKPLGQVADPQLERIEIPGRWQELVLCSDGARLDLGRVNKIEPWLVGLRAWEAEGGDGTVEPWKPHDDVTVVRVRPRA